MPPPTRAPTRPHATYQRDAVDRSSSEVPAVTCVSRASEVPCAGNIHMTQRDVSTSRSRSWLLFVAVGGAHDAARRGQREPSRNGDQDAERMRPVSFPVS